MTQSRCSKLPLNEGPLFSLRLRRRLDFAQIPEKKKETLFQGRGRPLFRAEQWEGGGRGQSPGGKRARRPRNSPFLSLSPAAGGGPLKKPSSLWAQSRGLRLRFRLRLEPGKAAAAAAAAV